MTLSYLQTFNKGHRTQESCVSCVWRSLTTSNNVIFPTTSLQYWLLFKPMRTSGLLHAYHCAMPFRWFLFKSGFTPTLWRPRELKWLTPNHRASNWMGELTRGSLMLVSTHVIMGLGWRKTGDTTTAQSRLKQESSCLRTQESWMGASVRCEWKTRSLHAGECWNIQVAAVWFTRRLWLTWENDTLIEQSAIQNWGSIQMWLTYIYLTLLI